MNNKLDFSFKPIIFYGILEEVSGVLDTIFAPQILIVSS